MDRQHKVWGERWLIRQDSTHAVSYLKLRKGYRCSWHRHSTKFNLFVVLRGAIEIETADDIGSKTQVLTLTEGECFTVRPGQFHEFRSIEDADVIEEMYVSYDEGDIYRMKVGGPYPEDEDDG